MYKLSFFLHFLKPRSVTGYTHVFHPIKRVCWQVTVEMPLQGHEGAPLVWSNPSLLPGSQFRAQGEERRSECLQNRHFCEFRPVREERKYEWVSEQGVIERKKERKQGRTKNVQWKKTRETDWLTNQTKPNATYQILLIWLTYQLHAHSLQSMCTEAVTNF